MKTPRLPSRPKKTGKAALPTSAVREGGHRDLEDVDDEADDRERRDRVQHDRHHDLVGTGEGLERPGMNPYSAPPSAPASRRSHRHRHRLVCHHGTDDGRKNPPTSTCPVPPMLNRPALKPTPTARPVRTSGPPQRLIEAPGCRDERDGQRCRAAVHVEEGKPRGAFKQGLVGLEREQKVELTPVRPGSTG